MSAFPKDQPIVIASHNKGKIREIGELLSPLGYQVMSTQDFPGLTEPEETEATFAGNALLKAKYVCEQTGLAALADDSGLSVPALKGEPGIYSARWAGPEKDFTMAMEAVRQKLKSTTGTDRYHSAYFHCSLALCAPTGETLEVEGQVYGMLTFPPRGDDGFGYDSIFLPAGHQHTFGEMTGDEKHAISHRAIAFKKLVKLLSA